MSTLALVSTATMLSIFYGQYRWLTADIVASSVEHHEESLAANFERRARARLDDVADNISMLENRDDVSVRRILERAISEYVDVVGLRFTRPNGSALISGTIAETPLDG